MVLPVHAATFSKPPSNFGLIGHWSFDEGVSTIVRDFSGNGFNGVMTNMDASTDWVAGKRGKALDFDGVDDYVALPSANLSSRVSGNTAITIAGWFKGSDIESMVRLQDGTAYIVLGWTSSGAFAPRALVSTDGGVTGVNIGGGNVHDGKWRHIAMTWEKNTTNGFKVYVDGSVTNQKDTPNVNLPVFSGSTGAYFGSYQGTSEFTAGSIDDVRIYNRALTRDEIKALATVGQTIRTGVSDRGILAHFTFDEGTSTIAHDFSGNGRNGNMTNMDANTDWVAGKKGKALDFDGTNDYVSFPVSGITSNTVTFVAWVKGVRTGAYTGILYLRNDPQSVGIHYRDATNDLTYTWNDNNVATYGWSSGLSIPLDTWSLVAVAIEPTKATAYLCTGDSCRSAENVITHNNQTLNGSFRIGGDAFAGTRSFDGNIDDVRIYNRTLSSSEVRALYQQNKTLINAPQKDQLTSGLVGYWSFNAPDIHWPTNVAYDRSGRGNNASIVNMSNSSSPVAGASGQALSFDGVDDSVEVNANPSINSNGSFTYSVWLKPRAYTNGLSTDGSGTYFFDRMTTSNSLISLKPIGNKYCLQKRYENSTGLGAVCTIGDIVLNEWTHIAFVRNYNSTFSIYRNGVFQSSVVDSGSLSLTPIRPLIGGHQSGTGRFDGNMDEFRIYDRALSADEVKKLYGMGRK